MKFKIGDEIFVNRRGEQYDYSRPTSTGVIEGFDVDKNSGEKVALIKFTTLVKKFNEEKNPVWPLYLNTITRNYKNKSKTYRGVKLIVCEDTGCYYPEAEIKEIDGRMVGKDSWKYYQECAHLKKVFDVTEMTRCGFDNKWYHKKAFAKLFAKCVRYGSMYPKKEMKKGLDGEWYSKDGWRETFAKCNSCNKIGWKNELRRYNRTDKMYCPDCWEDTVPIKNYYFNPKNVNFCKQKWEGKLMLGLEMEVMAGSNDDCTKIAQEYMDWLKAHKLNRYFYCKEDGSLRDEERNRVGFEIVTHPFTLQFAHKNLMLKKTTEFLVKQGVTSYETGRCGMHVHLSKNFFTEDEIRKFRLFCYTNYDQIYKFSKREGTGADYARKENYDFKKYKRKQDGQDTRMNILNLQTNKPTIELRIFRGTLKYSRIIATLQFCDAVAHFVKVYSVATIKQPGCWNIFKEWLLKNNQYHHLSRYLTKHEI